MQKPLYLKATVKTEKIFAYVLIRVALSMIEALKLNLPARIKVDAGIQTQRKMLIEFRECEQWNYQQVNSISSRRKQIFLLPAGISPTASLPGSMCLLIHQGGGGQQVS